MPIDSKRLPVPESSQNPHCFVVEEPKEIPLVNAAGRRADGRSPDELRPIFVKTGVISQARGSAYIELANTKLICAVYGPREVTRREDFSMKGQLMCEFKFATFSCGQRRGHQQDGQEKDYSTLISEALMPGVMMEKFPKARMDVFVTVIEDDGACLSAAITCASLALADAGVHMYDLVVGETLRQFRDSVLLDPCRKEEYSPGVGSKDAMPAGSSNGCLTLGSKDAMPAGSSNGCLTVGYMPSLNQVSALHQNGILTPQHANQAMRVCIDTCQRVYPVLQQALVKSLKRKLNADGT